ncbi:hypothetical protein Lal_00036200 [Lupinus albus]|nr:hypothetical protein Lal_00036200 [Lupinus albus]
MNKGHSPEPLDFFIWTVEDVGMWLETINLGSYRQIFKENGVNGEYLEGMSMFTTEQILRFIRRCHMKWSDFMTLCRELRRIKGLSLTPLQINPRLTLLPTPQLPMLIIGMAYVTCCGLSERGAKRQATLVGTGVPIRGVPKGCKIQQTIKSCFLKAGTMMIQQYYYNLFFHVCT